MALIAVTETESLVGNGLVVKRVEPAHEPGAPKLRLLSANPAYPPYTCLAADVHIVRNVLWKVIRP